MTTDFENGRKFEKLEEQIRIIHEDLCRKDNTYTEDLKKIIRETLTKAFTEYKGLASKYSISRSQTIKIDELYLKAFGEEPEPISLEAQILFNKTIFTDS